MTETQEPPKLSFAQRFAAERPKDEAELKAMQKSPDEKRTNTEDDRKSSDATGPTAVQQQRASSAAISGVGKASAPDPDEEIVSGKRSPKTDDFKRIKSAAAEAAKERDALKAKTEDYEKQLKELNKAPKHNAELIKQIEAERDEFKSKWTQVAAQFDSGFHAKYEAKVGDAIAKIKDAVPADRIDKISQLLQMPESEWKRKAMAELTEDLDTPTITDIMLANREVRDILAARKKELEDSGSILKASAEQRKKEQESRKEAYNKSFDAVLQNRTKGDAALPVLVAPDDAPPEVKSAVDERIKVARAIFMDEFETPEEKAEAAIHSASYPATLELVKSLQAENAQMKETLAKIQSASPRIAAAGKPAEGGKKMRFTERMMQNAL